MVDLIALALPETVKIKVDFYDDAQKALLLASAAGSVLQALPSELTISTSDLCGYYNYYKLRPGVRKFSSRGEVFEAWRTTLGQIDGLVRFGNGSIQLEMVAGTDTGVLGHIGEAVGLCVADKIHRLHEADWRRIPHTTANKILDFEYRASDGAMPITIETKGAGAADNRQKPSNVSGHKASIIEKKSNSANAAAIAGICYGTIAVLSDSPSSVAQCWLVDPPGTADADPFGFKLLCRLEFIAAWMRFISPRSALGAALGTRIATLQAIGPKAELDRVKLCKVSGEPFADTVFSGEAPSRNPFFAVQSAVSGRAIAGSVSVLSPRDAFFLGIREELVAYAVRQDFNELNGYGFEPEVVGAVLNCCIPAARFKREFAPLQFPGVENIGGYHRFRMDGTFYQTRSGLVFGILPIPQDWTRVRE